jgi:hypothetical protein
MYPSTNDYVSEEAIFEKYREINNIFPVIMLHVALI